ncbi:hypothetical protein ES708_02357 [subsurface metagenome]
MANPEDPFVSTALDAAKDVLGTPLLIKRGANLLYQVTVDNHLRLKVDPKHPKRGQSAFQTDLCVFEQIEKDVNIPRVVLEFKTNISTHDVITYSAKARKHKQVYPYLRYGLVIGNENTIPGRFFTHNEALDFCVAAASYKENRLHELFAKILREEVAASRELEQIAFGSKPVHVFRNEVKIIRGDGKII